MRPFSLNWNLWPYWSKKSAKQDFHLSSLKPLSSLFFPLTRSLLLCSSTGGAQCLWEIKSSSLLAKCTWSKKNSWAGFCFATVVVNHTCLRKPTTSTVVQLLRQYLAAQSLEASLTVQSKAILETFEQFLQFANLSEYLKKFATASKDKRLEATL